MSKKTWLLFGAVCIVLFGGLIFLSTKDRVNVADVNANAIQPANQQDGNIADHVFGNTKSPVQLIEYGDFECPYCGEAYPQVKKVTEKYQGQVAFVFRNMPLTTIHPNALAGAGVAEAAGLQGKYWEMHDLLYTSQNDWTSLSGDQLTNQFISYAKQLGLNTTTFQNDLAGSRIQQKISFDRALYNKLGQDPSTPTFLLDGKEISTSLSQNIIAGDGSQLDAALASALKAKGLALPQS